MDSRLRDRDCGVRQEGGDLLRGRQIDVERGEVAVVDSDDAGTEIKGELGFVNGVDLDQRADSGPARVVAGAPQVRSA